MWRTAERAKNVATEKELALLIQKVQEQEEKLKAQQKSYNENMAQLKIKLERTEKTLLEETERMLEHKLKVKVWVWLGIALMTVPCFLRKGSTKILTKVMYPERNPKSCDSVKCQKFWIIQKP